MFRKKLYFMDSISLFGLILYGTGLIFFSIWQGVCVPKVKKAYFDVSITVHVIDFLLGHIFSL